MSTASSIKGKQLPAHSISIEIYSEIARFSCNSMALVPNMQALLSFSDFYHASAFTQIDIAISSVRLSVTIRYRVKTAKPIVEILSPPDSPTNLFSDKINRCSEIRNCESYTRNVCMQISRCSATSVTVARRACVTVERNQQQQLASLDSSD